MTRSIMLLITLIMISFSLSIMPLDVKSFEINFDNIFKPIEKPEVAIETPSSFTIASVSSEENLYYNPETLYYKASALDTPPENWSSLIKGTLLIEDVIDNKSVLNISGADLDRYLKITPKSNLQNADIELNIKDFLLPNGLYTLSLSIESPELTKTFHYNLQQFKAMPYVSQRGVEVGNTLKFFFIDESQTLLIPVYRPLESTDHMIRAALNGLLAVPEDMGLYSGPLVPRVSRADFSGGVTKCSLLTRDLSEALTDEQAKLVFLSIAKTLFDVKSTYIINQVEFLIDSNPSATFKGLDLSSPYLSNENAQVYLPYVTRQKLLLVPFELGTNDPTTAIKDIFQAMTTLKGVSIPTKGVTALFPPAVELLDQHIEGRNLILNFNDNFKDIYKDQPQLQNMLIDALALSFTTIEGVDQITIKVSGNTFHGWDDAPLKEAMTPPSAFNLVQ